MYRNDGGSFTSVSVGANDAGDGRGAAFGDYDDDGDLDLYVVNVNQANKLFTNDGDGTFTDTGGTTANTGEGLGVVWLDYDNDRDLDLYLAQTGASTAVLYRNDGGGTFSDQTSTAGVGNSTDNGSGIAVGDYNNDGHLDIYVANVGQANRLYLNKSDGTFTDVTTGAGVGNGSSNLSINAVWGDYDGDGDLDLYVTNANTANALFMNDGTPGDYLFVALEGTVSNECGQGAKVEVVAGGQTQRRDIDGGSGWGSQAILTEHFGLDGYTTVDSVKVEWPSGITQHITTGLTKNTTVTVTEPSLVEFADVTASPLNVAATGRGASWVDYDGDNDLDLYVANAVSGANSLFRNDGGGSFASITGSPVNTTGNSHGVSWADYDSDGDLDLYVTTNSAANKLFRNDGGSTFSDQTTASGTGATSSNFHGAWADYDRDGDPDLYVSNNAGANLLYENDGSGVFTDEALTASVNHAGAASAASWGDYNSDGWPDLYVANGSGQANILYRGNTDGVFTDNTGSTGGSSNSKTGTWIDFDNDGFLDLFVINSGAADILYRSTNGNGAWSVNTNLNDSGSGHVGGWADYDNDGDVDLFLGRSAGDNLFYLNNGDQTFDEVTYGVDLDESPLAGGMSWGDYDADGDLDLYVVDVNGSNGGNMLFRNENSTANKYLIVKLDASVSPTKGIGARIKTVAGGTTRIREVGGGSGIFSQPSLDVEFGFGATATLDSLVVEWPSGLRNKQTNVSTNQVLTVTEPAVTEFTEIAATAGVADATDFKGASWADYDGDGDLDLYVAGQSAVPNRLYRNNGSSTFTNVATAAPLNESNQTLGVPWGDFDNDGDLDLYLTIGNVDNSNRLLRNDGSGSFTNVASTAGVTGQAGSFSQGAAWGDYDGDGDIDLYVCVPSDPNLLYINDGSGSFIDDAAGLGVDESSDSELVTWVDYDNDADLDLFVSTLDDDAILYRNDSGSFTNVATSLGINDSGAMGTWGDYDNDGDFDVFYNFDGNTSKLFRNNGNSTFTHQVGVAAQEGLSGDAGWADYDLDGDLDLFVANADNIYTNFFYLNNGDGSFTDVTQPLGMSDADFYGEGAAWGDYDNDGDPDLFVPQTNNLANQLYRNDNSNGNKWLVVRPEGRLSPRDGHSAVVTAYTGATPHVRRISPHGRYADSALQAHFGLGTATTVDSLVIQWPNGHRQVQTAITSLNDSLRIVQQSSTWKEIGAAAGVQGNNVSYGASWADYDADGDPDL